MKQAQSEATDYRTPSQWGPKDFLISSRSQQSGKENTSRVHVIGRSGSPFWGELLVASVKALWFVVSLPFRLVFWTIAWLGRATAVALGFTLMVVGMALWAGPLFFIGIPLFLVGLVLTLRCLN
jgi:hypothetical protein